MNEKLQNALNIVKDINSLEEYGIGDKVEAIRVIVKESLKSTSQIKASDVSRRDLLKALDWLVREHDDLEKAFQNYSDGVMSDIYESY